MNLRTQSWIRSVAILFSPCKGSFEYRNDVRENDPLYTLDKASSVFSVAVLKTGDPHWSGIFICVDSIRLYMCWTFIGRGLVESAFIMLCIENGFRELHYYRYSNSPNAPSILLFR